MYILQPQAQFIDFSHQTILSLIQSVNAPMVAAGDFPAEETQGFVVSLQARDQSIQVFIYLHLQGSNQCAIFRFDPSPIMGDRLQAAESEALDFVESMGFMMDNLNFSRLNAADQARLLKELPVFYTDLAAYLPMLEQKREAQGQGSLENLPEGEGMAASRSVDHPSGQYFPRSDMMTASGTAAMNAPSSFVDRAAESASEGVEATPVALPEPEVFAAPPFLEAESLQLEDALVEPPGAERPMDSPNLDGVANAPSENPDDELSQFFQPENIPEMVAEIDRTEVARPVKSVEPVAPARPVAPLEAEKVSPPTLKALPASKSAVQPMPAAGLSPEEKRRFLKLILSA